MALARAAEQAVLNQLIKYLDNAPEMHIDRIMDVMNALAPERVFPTQRAVCTEESLEQF